MAVFQELKARLNDNENAPITKQELILVRGASGSGKSTFVKKNFPKYTHLETDMYWYDDNGNYNFDPKQLPTAHQWCQKETRKNLEQGKNVIVSNTFIKKWEIQPYIDMAEQMGIPYQIYRLTTQFDNVHEVPEDVVKRMRNNIEPIDGEIVI